jgi:hypothetical protein
VHDFQTRETARKETVVLQRIQDPKMHHEKKCRNLVRAFHENGEILRITSLLTFVLAFCEDHSMKIQK